MCYTHGSIAEIPTNDDRERKRERGERLTKGRLIIAFRLTERERERGGTTEWTK